MTQKIYANQGNAYFPTDKSAFQDALPVGTYSVNFNPQKGFFFTKIDDMEVPLRCYGDTNSKASRILHSFDERKGATTGVLLAGLKGTGKTMLVKKLSQDLRAVGISTFVVNEPHAGDSFNKLIQEIGSCLVVFDEFEKVYDRRELQEAMLTLLDGTFNSHKLVAITCNDPWRLNDHLQNRPGRILYSLEYGSLSQEIIREYCAEHLKDPSKLEALLRAATLINDFTMDMLIAMVAEMNRFDETASEVLKWLNIRPPSEISYEVETAFLDNKKLTPELIQYRHNGNPLTLDEDDSIEVRLLRKHENGSLQVSGWYYFEREDVKNYAGERITLEKNNEHGTLRLELKRKQKTYNYHWGAF